MSRFQEDFTRQTLGLMQPDFERTGSQWAPGADGQTLVEYDRSPNLLKNSLLLDDDTGLSSAPAVQADGSYDVTEDSSGGTRHSARHSSQLSVTSGTTYTIYARVKKGASDWIQVTPGSGGFGPNVWANFNLNTGVVGNVGGGVLASSITQDGDYYICSLTGVATATVSDSIYVAGTNNTDVASRLLIYTGSGATIAYVRGLGYNEGSSPNLPLVINGADNAAPAFDAQRGWLAEESRTNLLSNSIDLTNVTHWNGTTQITLTGGQSDILGGSDGFLIAPTATVSGHYIFDSVGAITSGNWYTLTFWGRPAGYDWIQVTTATGFTGQKWRNVNLQDGSLGNGDLTADSDDGVLRVEAAPGGRFRVRLSAKATSTVAGQMIIAFLDSDRTSRLEAFAGDGSSGAIIEHPQFEQGAFPTSYIPTNGSTATRQPTSLSGVPASVWAPGAGAVTNNFAGVVVITPASDPSKWSEEGRILEFSNALSSPTDRAIIRIQTNGKVSVYRAGSGGVLDLSSTSTVSGGAQFVIAYSFTSSATRLWVNGVLEIDSAVSAATADHTSGLQYMALGTWYLGNDLWFSGVYAGLQIWTGADVPSDAELAALTADDLLMTPLTVSGGTSSGVTVTAPDVSAFRVGQPMNHIRWGQTRDVVFETDAGERVYGQIELTPPVPTRFGAIVTPNATYHPGAAIATDESYGLFTVGEGTHDPADGDTTANVFVAGAATFQPFAYDISAGNWIEGTAVELADGAASGGGAGGKLSIGMAIGL